MTTKHWVEGPADGFMNDDGSYGRAKMEMSSKNEAQERYDRAAHADIEDLEAWSKSLPDNEPEDVHVACRTEVERLKRSERIGSELLEQTRVDLANTLAEVERLRATLEGYEDG
jgi:hypothetical protein